MYELSGVWLQPWAQAQGRRRQAWADPPPRVIVLPPLLLPEELAIRAEMERRLVQRGWLIPRVTAA